jgi:hypothetical protein
VSTTEGFVGRTRELGAFDAAFAAARAGAGSLVVVSGEAGIGKTRLCTEVAARAGAAGLTVASARCWVDGGAPPLWPWGPVLAELGDGADVLRAAEIPDVGTRRRRRATGIASPASSRSPSGWPRCAPGRRRA